MLGHKVVQTFSARFDTWATMRREPDERAAVLFRDAQLITDVSVEDFDSVVEAIGEARADAVVNCIGIVKQADEAKDPISSIIVNSLFPHRLAGACEEAGARLIHISTDCVFSGRRGFYSEGDIPDPPDLYGRSKLLGETVAPRALTIRTSIIGRELSSSYGLLEWFVGEKGQLVRGYARAVFSGFPTRALARHLAYLLEFAPDVSGLRHLASAPVSKYDLLTLVKDVYDLDVEIERDDTFVCDRSLDGTLLLKETGITIEPWREMIEDMCLDPTPYRELRAAVPC